MYVTQKQGDKLLASINRQVQGVSVETQSMRTISRAWHGDWLYIVNYVMDHMIAHLSCVMLSLCKGAMYSIYATMCINAQCVVYSLVMLCAGYDIIIVCVLRREC